MTMEELGKKLWTEHNDEWQRINAILSKNEVEEVLEEVAGEADLPSEAEILGLDTSDDYTPEETALARLRRKATGKMWKGIGKEKANSLIRALYDVNAETVKMPDGGEYTIKDINKAWKEWNGAE